MFLGLFILQAHCLQSQITAVSLSVNGRRKRMGFLPHRLRLKDQFSLSICLIVKWKSKRVTSVQVGFVLSALPFTSPQLLSGVCKWGRGSSSREDWKVFATCRKLEGSLAAALSYLILIWLKGQNASAARSGTGSSGGDCGRKSPALPRKLMFPCLTAGGMVLWDWRKLPWAQRPNSRSFFYSLVNMLIEWLKLMENALGSCPVVTHCCSVTEFTVFLGRWQDVVPGIHRAFKHMLSSITLPSSTISSQPLPSST